MFDHTFATASEATLYRGFFATFDEATSQAPKTKPMGYDNRESAALYEDRLERPMAWDYPVMFWLAQILAESSNVVDIGGHVGVSCYAFENHLAHHTYATWTVMDVPAVVARGRELAARRGRKHLRFVTDLADAPQADVLLASGSLQYIDEPFTDLVARLSQKPRYIIVNKTPLSTGESFVTLQSIGTAYCPYRVFNRTQFLKGLESIDYELMDEWDNPGLSCKIGVGSERDIPAYSGLYLRLGTGDRGRSLTTK